jgi:hypothetical protein
MVEEDAGSDDRDHLAREPEAGGHLPRQEGRRGVGDGDRGGEAHEAGDQGAGATGGQQGEDEAEGSSAIAVDMTTVYSRGPATPAPEEFEWRHKKKAAQTPPCVLPAFPLNPPPCPDSSAGRARHS